MNQHDAPLPPLQGPWIEIRGGRTRFPRRPITGGRLLIGSGSNCHLQLGGGIPMAHSVIRQENEGWTIEALASEPRLMVGGAVARRSALRDGDVIEVGRFRLIAHLPHVAENELLAPIDVPGTLALAAGNDGEFAASLASLSAEELVDRLAADVTAAVMAARGDSAADALGGDAEAADDDSIDDGQLVAEVMAQLAAMSERLAARDDGEGSVLPLTSRGQATGKAPLRKSA